MTAALLLACPVCAQQPVSAVSSLLVVGFIAVPFIVAAFLIHAIRNVDT